MALSSRRPVDDLVCEPKEHRSSASYHAGDIFTITVINARRNVGRGVTIPCAHRDTDAIGNGRDMWRAVSYCMSNVLWSTRC